MSQQRCIYLDNSATTYTDSRVIEEMLPYLGQIYGNASSQHFMGREALKAVDIARAKIIGLLRASFNQKPTKENISSRLV